MAVEPGVNGNVVDILVVKVRHDPFVCLIVARNGVSVVQKLIAGETNYLDPFSQVFPLGEIVDVRCDDDDAITLVGQLARKVLGVLFNASDVRELVGGKYAEGVVLVRQCVTEPDLERCLHWRARLGQSRLGSDRLSPAFSRAEPALARGS